MQRTSSIIVDMILKFLLMRLKRRREREAEEENSVYAIVRPSHLIIAANGEFFQIGIKTVGFRIHG